VFNIELSDSESRKATDILLCKTLGNIFTPQLRGAVAVSVPGIHAEQLPHIYCLSSLLTIY